MTNFFRFFAGTMRVLFFLFLAHVAFAQEPALPDTAAWVVVRTTDGNEFIGQILSQDADAVVLKSELFGQLVLRRAIIQGIRPVKKPKIVNGKIWFENPHAPRYFVAPSAYGLRKGEGVYENSELFLSQVSYGFTDHFSLGIGFAPFTIFYDGPFPVWLVPKFSFPIKSNKINVAFGGLIGHEFNRYYEFSTRNPNFNAVYGQFTYGSRDANVSVGVGLNFSHGTWAKSPIYSLAGTVRLAPPFALLGESFFFRDEHEAIRIFGLGVRFMGRRIALDAGVAISAAEFDGVYPVPWGSLHVPFGSPK